MHLKNIFSEGEVQRDSVIKESLITASDGKKYRTQLYRLEVIMAVGYRVSSHRGTQSEGHFRSRGLTRKSTHKLNKVSFRNRIAPRSFSMPSPSKYSVKTNSLGSSTVGIFSLTLASRNRPMSACHLLT